MTIRPGAASAAVRYQFTADASEDDIQAALAILSEEERARAARFRFPRDRRDYALAHALLRTMLSVHGNRRPHEWTFRVDAHGKPHVAEGAPIAFSLSHTDGLVACGVAATGTIGVDVERVGRVADWRAIAMRNFSAAEQRALAAAPDDNQPTAFIEIWTLKEAFAKALGLGLSQPLDATTFSVDAGGVVRFGAPAGIEVDAWRFSLHAPAPAYRLAVAMAAGAEAEWNLQVTAQK